MAEGCGNFEEPEQVSKQRQAPSARVVCEAEAEHVPEPSRQARDQALGEEEQ